MTMHAEDDCWPAHSRQIRLTQQADRISRDAHWCMLAYILLQIGFKRADRVRGMIAGDDQIGGKGTISAARTRFFTPQALL